MQLSELFSGNQCRGLGERTGGLLGLRKGDHVPDGAGTGQDHQEAIYAKGGKTLTPIIFSSALFFRYILTHLVFV